MKKAVFCLTAALGTLLGMSSCSLFTSDDDPKCGAANTAYHWRTSHGTGFFSTSDNPSYLVTNYTPGSPGNRSTLIFYKWTENVCPEEHVKFKAHISGNIEADLNVSAKAEWYFFFEEQLTLNISSDGVSRNWDGSGEFGLKQVYGDEGVGEFTLTASVDFPFQGSFEADTAYLFDKLQNVTLEADFKNAKN